MRQINLSQNKIAILDDKDFERLAHFHWCYRGERNSNNGYAMRHAKQPQGGSKTEYLHRAIMNPPPETEVIFLNHDRLDCRRENLKIVDKVQARRHHRARRDAGSGFKGVKYNNFSRSWTARTYRSGKMYTLGTFNSLSEANAAYEKDIRSDNPDLYTAPAVVERIRPVEDDNEAA